MVKVRVYELAKELNLESKDLVEQLIAEGIDVKNYMSTLDDELAAMARRFVSGEISEVIEEKRIKSTVIRRRKKLVKIKQEHTPEASELEIKKEQTASEEISPSLEDFKAIDGLAQEAGFEESILTEPEKEEEDTIKILEEEGKPDKKTVSATGDASELGAATPIEEKEIKPDKIKLIKESKARPKKAKKKQMDQPAKIIKLPEEGSLGGILAKRIKQQSIEKAGMDATLEISKKIPDEIDEKKERAKPAKRKRDKKQIEIDELQEGREYRRKKKEIYERAELYDGRPFKHKAKPAGKKAKEAAKKVRQTEITVPKPIKRRLKVQELVTVAELAKAMGTKSTDLIARLMGLGVTSHINQPLDFETASVVADEFGYELELDTFEEEQVISEAEDLPEDLKSRPPVVTIMGHVDHGKTSLLDYIRKSNIIGGESGGITQHIGAYYVASDKGDIVFLDTPGHEAFTAMRARGAKVTDIIVLVVAADDGVMPQTKEAINHARAANIPILVAINKIDKPEADQEKVRRELADLELVPEDWGGETIYGNISAKTGEGIEDLLGLILLQAEMLELKANPEKPARGTIIEAKLDKSKGPVSTVLIKNGTLRQGDFFICGDHYGKVRAMLDHRGKKINAAGPSAPVEIYGISGVPMAGDELVVVQDERTAKQVIEHRRAKIKKAGDVRQGLISLDDFFDRVKDGEVKELNIILKTDVQGSLEALTEALIKLSTEEVRLKVIHSATGTITESDVMLASASGGIIIGFNVRANPRVSEIAEKEKVDIRYYDVIYNATKDIRLAMAGLLEPTYEERIIGRADIKEIFRVPKVGTVAGCQVTEGHVERNANARLLRDNVVVFDGKIASLRRFKDDVKEVQSGYECGIGLENFNDIKPGDVCEVYLLDEIQAEL